MDAAIEAHDVGKLYRLGTRRAGLWQKLRGGSMAGAPTFWALRDVSFRVAPGEVLGIIGANGAGKSTLLKILSRITEPTTGRIALRGRVASLLEVGTGFHPELSGRDNIFLNGSILGLGRAEIRARFDEIVAFAGVERFLDTPVKHYSSGMYVRLAFAVAAHLAAEILIVDEVLAVGDTQFQQKCLGKMQAVARDGRTVLFVSHNLAVVGHLCTRALLLERGQLVSDERAADAVTRYLGRVFPARRSCRFPDDPHKRAQIRALRLDGLPEGPDGVLLRTAALRVTVEYEVRERLVDAHLGLMLERPDGTAVLHSRDVDALPQRDVQREPGHYRAIVEYPGNLLNAGPYTLRVGVAARGGDELIDHQHALAFELHDPAGEIAARSWGRPRPGVLYLPLPWQTSRMAVNAAAVSGAESRAAVVPLAMA